MEFALNSLWFLLALASFALWQRYRSRAATISQKRNHWGGGLVALGCALAVLFPVISISDDLQAEQAILEDSSPTKRTVKSLDSGKAPSSHGKCNHPAINYGQALSCFFPNGAAGRTSAVVVVSPKTASISPNKGRAPPSLHD